MQKRFSNAAASFVTICLDIAHSLYIFIYLFDTANCLLAVQVGASEYKVGTASQNNKNMSYKEPWKKCLKIQTIASVKAAYTKLQK